MEQQITVRISAAINQEYDARCPEGLPESVDQGVCRLTLDEARWLLSDAEHNSSRGAFDVGPLDMPYGTFRAYRALAQQLRAAIAKAKGGAA